MRKQNIILLVFLLCAPLTARQNFGGADGVRSIIDTERAFAKAAAAQGTRAAFLAFISDQGILFRPGPVGGKEWLLKSQPSPGLLSWIPVRAEAAGTGDLGYTTGPWEYRASASEKPGAYGQFVTVWKKEENGAWKFVLNHGISHAQPGPAKAGLVLSTGSSRGSASDLQAARSSLMEADRNLKPESYSRAAAEDIRLLRPNSFPIDGRQAVAAQIAEIQGVPTSRPAGSSISAGADLAYTWGVVGMHQEGRPAQESNYVRIWRKKPGQPWKIVIDMATPVKK